MLANVWILFLLPGMWAAPGPQSVDFNRDIRPILSDKCFYCHGPDEQNRKGGLRLDEERSAKAPRKRGTAVIGGNEADSLLMKRIRSQDPNEVMPPPGHNKDLSPRQVELISRWVREGAPWAVHWSYAPLAKYDSTQTIDSLLQKSLKTRGLDFSPEADRVTLERRIQFDLLGMIAPPKNNYRLKEKDLSIAVERMLESDAHAERMASWWLDLVRYADTVGYHGDQDHNASPYRDWVIDAFAQNMRFDRFTQLQLAGDLMGIKGDEATRGKIASCYNRLLQTSHEGGVQPKEYLAMYAADRVRNFGSVWLGATLGCAQCHTHKFDPYTIGDYYRFAAFFADIDEEKHLRGGGGDTVPTKRPPEISVVTDRDREALLRAKTSLEEARRIGGSTTVKGLEAEVQRLSKPRMVMITQAIEPRTTRILARGNWMDESGEIVQPGIPSFLGSVKKVGDRSTRLDLALWLTDTNTGAGRLAARVLANRLWALFFGEGISPTLEDLGSQGDPPTHPELLDHLANELIQSGWDIRGLIRKIVTSRAYRQSSKETPKLREVDPNNHLFARQSSYRLPAEMVRDTILATSGLLEDRVGGPSIKPYQPEGYYNLLNFPKRTYKPSQGADQYRRGLYIHWQRQFLHPMLRAFDAPSREECVVRRPRSNTPRSALVLLNDPSFVEAAAHFYLLYQNEKLPTWFHRVTGRMPTDAELKELQELHQTALDWFANNPGHAGAFLVYGSPKDWSSKPESAAWVFTLRALFNLAETTTRN